MKRRQKEYGGSALLLGLLVVIGLGWMLVGPDFRRYMKIEMM